MSTENPNWQQEVQRLVPKWGTTLPLTFDEIKIPLLDIYGRTLLESENYNPANVLHQHGKAHSDGGREGREVNSSAYAAVIDVFDEAQGLVSHLHDVISPYNRKRTANSVASVLNATFGLPFWLVHRADGPTENGKIPSYITAAAKAARGAAFPYEQSRVSIIVQDLGIAVTDAPPSDVLTSKELYIHNVFDKRLLVAQEGTMACPASSPIIEQFAGVLFESPSEKKKEMGSILNLSRDEIRRVNAFGTALNDANILYGIYNEIASDPKRFTSIPQAVIEERYHEKMNIFQKRMNRTLGREEPQLPTGIPSAFRRR